MKIAVLTSSRADYGIYLPLLNEIKKDHFFDLEIIAFGTHLSSKHGYTLDDIEKDGYDTIHKIISLIDDDSEKGIVVSYGRTVLEFSNFWENKYFDLVFCLGDRFEMNAAVQACIPFGIKLAHIHGGENTLGAIDNKYRHQITIASDIHFVSTTENLTKVKELTGHSKFIFNVGSLSLNDIKKFQPINKSFFYDNFKIQNKPFALVTFHPETVSVKDNYSYAAEMSKALIAVSDKLNLVITMPNADTLGSVYREEIYKLKNKIPNSVLLIENFGKINYFNAMYYSSILIGNTSSGIIEAASFGKYVVNVGDRQKGRSQSKNILNVQFNHKDLILKVNEALILGDFEGDNVYFKQNVVNNFIGILKKAEILENTQTNK
jgi:GDP/UDP-N,N'-diacetylbacillosamine 2-epimerase (hydrolysing)